MDIYEHNPPQCWDLHIDDLDEWVESVARPAIEAVLDPNAPLVVDDDACRWCRAKAVCPEHAKAMVAVVTGEPVAFDNLDDLPVPAPETLTPEQLARVLPHLPALAGWCEAVKEHALHLAVTGHEVPGWKAVEGRRGVRTWTDEAHVEQVFKSAFKMPDELIYTKKLISPAQAEKVIDRKNKWRDLQEFIQQAAGKPTLAPVTDKRPALTVQFDVIDEA